MENNFFIFTENSPTIELERFHICTWEFKNGSSLIEFGGEIINPKEYTCDSISLCVFVPWVTEKHKITDLYDRLKESENSKFIFNDSVSGNKFLDDGQKKDGVIQEFNSRNPLCIVPIKSSINQKTRTITIKINLKPFKETESQSNTTLYFRFYLEPNINLLSTRKTGISRSTIIYDIKVNEKRNLPQESNFDLRKKELSKIGNCFVFNILPNSYDLTFFDTSSLKNIRTLEFGSFKKYLGDNRVKKDELVVVFNKKKDQESYAFFSVYSKERIGAGQFALAVLVSLVSGILLFIPSYRNSQNLSFFSKQLWLNFPIEVYCSISIGLIIVGYFIWPKIIIGFKWVGNIFKKKNKKS